MSVIQALNESEDYIYYKYWSKKETYVRVYKTPDEKFLVSIRRKMGKYDEFWDAQVYVVDTTDHLLYMYDKSLGYEDSTREEAEKFLKRSIKVTEKFFKKGDYSEKAKKAFVKELERVNR